MGAPRYYCATIDPATGARCVMPAGHAGLPSDPWPGLQITRAGHVWEQLPAELADEPDRYTGPSWVFTFGHGQRLRSTSRDGVAGSGHDPQDLGIGFRLDNRYVRINLDQPKARVLMFAIFGQVWSMEYDAADPNTDAMIDEYGLVELDITEPLSELAKREQLAEGIQLVDYGPHPTGLGEIVSVTPVGDDG